MRSERLLLLALLLALFPGAAQAHDARPLAVTITEQEGGRYAARLNVPPSVEVANRPQIVWPAGCVPIEQDLTRVVVRCDADLRGQSVAVRFSGYNPSLSVLFRLELADGRAITQLQPPDAPHWTVPLEPSARQVFGDYLRLGIEHIWFGFDHLLFVAGLVILARTARRVFWAVTGFTLAHSLTLALATLGLVRPIIPAVEAVIALSILFVAREIARPGAGGLAARQPILVSSLFGLLHGFGFAAALQEIGLPQGELALGLLSFNLGVELGQIAFICALMLTYALASLALVAVRPGRAPPVATMRLAVAYLIGVPAAYWLVERLLPIFG